MDTDSFGDEEWDPEAAERAIREFIDSAESLPGPAVGELADLVEGVTVEAWGRIQELMSGQRHNKVLATSCCSGSGLGRRRRMIRSSGGCMRLRHC